MEYKTSFSQDSFEAVTVARGGRQVQHCGSSSDSPNVANLPKPGQCPKASSSALSVEKKKDLQSMLQFMQQVDRAYIQTLLSPATSSDRELREDL